MLDLAIVGISLVTASYCLVLNRRLKRLHDLKGGLGGAVTALARSVSQLRKESEAVSARMNAASDRVERLLAQVSAAEPRIDVLLETMDRQARQVWREDKARMERARREMAGIHADAKAIAQVLNEQLCLLAEQSERQGPSRAPSKAPAGQAAQPAQAAARLPSGPAGRAAPTKAADALAKPAAVVRVAAPAPRQDNPFAKKAASR